MTGSCSSDWKPREVEVEVERVARKDDLIVVANSVLQLRQSACEPRHYLSIRSIYRQARCVSMPIQSRVPRFRSCFLDIESQRVPAETPEPAPSNSTMLLQEHLRTPPT